MRLFLIGGILGFLIGMAVTMLYFAFKILFATHAKVLLTETHSLRQVTSAGTAEIGPINEKVRAKGA
jgi:hypothetical protein